MARPRNRNRKNRGLDKLLEQGVLACAAGVGMLLFPLFAGKSPVLATLATVAGRFGWWVIALGVVLLGLHYLAKKSQSQPDVSHESAGSSSSKTTLRPRKAAAVGSPRTEPQWSGNAGTFATPAAQAASASDQGASHLLPVTWSADVFAAIEWRRFEAVCETLFAQAGFQTRSQSHGADGGVDIWLHSRNAQGPVSVVQCKHWQGKPVGVKEMREFFGVMASHQLKRGTYATTSSYTPDAQQFAKANGINALDGAGLLKLIATRTPEQQQALLQVAFEGDYGRPTCASCGIKMVERTPSKGGTRFWGCSGYPRCKSRLPMAAALR